MTRLAGAAAWIADAPRWALVLAMALVARAVTFGNPLVHVDEVFYLGTAQAMLAGQLPYVDIWDRKPIGLFLIYLPAAAFGPAGGVWVYQAMALASLVATALVAARIAERAGWERGASLAALLYVLWPNLADGQGGQAPIFYNLLTALAILLALPRGGEDAVRRLRGIGAMALIGLALQVKYSVLFEGMFLGLWLLWRERQTGVPLPRILPYAALLVATALVPTALVGLVYWALGHGEAWVFANFTSILHRQSDAPAKLAINAARAVATLLPLVAMSLLSLRGLARDDRERDVRRLLFGWLAAAVVGLVGFGSWFSHYALPVMLPAAICSAGFLGHSRKGQVAAVPLLVLALVAGQVVVRTTARAFGDADQLATVTEAVGRGPGCLFVYSGNPVLYGQTGRCRLTRFAFPDHLSLARERGATGVDQLGEISRVLARRPEVVVMRQRYRGEWAEARVLTLRTLVRDGYRRTGRYPLGNTMLSIYRRPEAAR